MVCRSKAAMRPSGSSPLRAQEPEDRSTTQSAHLDSRRALQPVERQPWDQTASVRFEDLAPVSTFSVVPGRRWGPGWWWSVPTGRHTRVLAADLNYLEGSCGHIRLEASHPDTIRSWLRHCVTA